jgi:hypothetical protein
MDSTEKSWFGLLRPAGRRLEAGQRDLRIHERLGHLAGIALRAASLADVEDEPLGQTDGARGPPPARAGVADESAERQGRGSMPDHRDCRPRLTQGRTKLLVVGSIDDRPIRR